MKARLAALYLPLIGIVIKALPQLYDPNTEGRYRTAAELEEMDTINHRVAMAIAGQNLFGRFSDQSHTADVNAKVVYRLCLYCAIFNARFIISIFF